MSTTNKTFRATNKTTNETVSFAFAGKECVRCNEVISREAGEIEIAELIIANWEIKRAA